MVKDRTAEFEAIVETNITRSVAGVGFNEPLLGVRSPKSPKSPTTQSHHTEFTKRATEINVGIQKVLSMLEKLTKCTSSCDF